MAKKYTSPTVMLPHFDASGERCWTTYRFTGETCKRQIKRAIRASFKAGGAKVHTRFIYEVMRRYLMTGPVEFVHTRVAGDAPQD